jgi:redox-sensitive bicupin YhaK (pirin superfamily)
MDIVHAAEMPWGESLVAQRGGGDVAHKRLFEGEEGSPDHYMLVMAKEPKSFFSPRHRHPWDQIRYCLEGKIPVAKGVFVEGGEIAYFPESVRYGPQEGGEDRIVVLLQFGGASGQGFIGADRVKQARLELAKQGRFEGGVYTREVAQGRKNYDAYEAIWHQVMGGELSYARPVYKTPIIMRPEALPWLPTPEAGVSAKSIGVFPHRGLSMSAWRIEPGARHTIPPSGTLRLLFVTDGGGTIGAADLRRWSTVRLHEGENTELVATSRLDLVQLAVQPVKELQRNSSAYA